MALGSSAAARLHRFVIRGRGSGNKWKDKYSRQQSETKRQKHKTNTENMKFMKPATKSGEAASNYRPTRAEGIAELSTNQKSPLEIFREAAVLKL